MAKKALTRISKARISAIRLSTAKNVEEALEAAARFLFEDRYGKDSICPKNLIPRERDMAAWVQGGGEKVNHAAEESCVALQEILVALGLIQPRAGPDPQARGVFLHHHPQRLLFFAFSNFAVSPCAASAPKQMGADEVSSLWQKRFSQNKATPKHPLVPLVEGWQEWRQLQNPSVRTPGHFFTRRSVPISEVALSHWKETSNPTICASVVDGEPMTARLLDPPHVFPGAVSQNLKNPESDQLYFNLEIPRRRTSFVLRAVSYISNPNLKRDTLTLLNLVHSLAWKMPFHEKTGAALLARHHDGRYRDPEKSDITRFWKAAEACIRLGPATTADSVGRFTVFVASEDPRDPRHLPGIVLGPPAWLRAKGVQYTLTAEGGQSAQARIRAGVERSGRIVTGLEFYLATSFAGKSNSIAPYLEPQRRGGPGPEVFVPWNLCLKMAGDAWDEWDPRAKKAAVKSYNRFVNRLETCGYFTSDSLLSEAAAGDSIEILERKKGGNGRTAGVRIRASARFCQAAAVDKAQKYDLMSLQEWTGCQGLNF